MAMKTDAKTFTALLPALQHLARFPTANLEHVCKTRGVDAGAVRGALVDMVGDVTRWDEEYLMVFADKLGVKVPPYQPAKVIARATEISVSITKKDAAEVSRVFGGNRGGKTLAAAAIQANAAVHDRFRRRHKSNGAASSPAVKVETPTPSSGRARYQEIVEELTAGASNHEEAAGAPPAPSLPEACVWPWMSVQRPRVGTFNQFWPVLLAIAQGEPAIDVMPIVRAQGVPWRLYRNFVGVYWEGAEVDRESVEAFRQWAVTRWGADALVESARTPVAARVVGDAQVSGSVAPTSLPETGTASWRMKVSGGRVEGIEINASCAVSELLTELVSVAKAYGRAERRCLPRTRLRRSLIEICTEVVEIAVPGGAAAVADGKAQS